MSQRIDADALKADVLKDVLIQLFDGKYSNRFILEVLAWGEQNTQIFWPMIKEYQPEYYNENLMQLFGNPVKIFTLMQDLKIKGIIK